MINDLREETDFVKNPTNKAKRKSWTEEYLTWVSDGHIPAFQMCPNSISVSEEGEAVLEKEIVLLKSVSKVNLFDFFR